MGTGNWQTSLTLLMVRPRVDLQHAMIERDVKQAVRLLEMSLSGLVSAENALKRWKGQMPDKVTHLAPTGAL